ncbi:hypothetical protein HK405_007985 [Cladochytrium tenue]|nr:hypothetical protein HK405_007985 [Cladochytrium tenue]
MSAKAEGPPAAPPAQTPPSPPCSPTARDGVDLPGNILDTKGWPDTTAAPAAAGDELQELRCKITELEALLKSEKDGRERDRQAAAEDSARKAALADRMRVKLNRFEFAVKEAVLFLAKPMDAYEAWLSRRSNDSGSLSAVNGFDGHGDAAAGTARLAAAVASSLASAGQPQSAATKPAKPATNAAPPSAQARPRACSASPRQQAPPSLALPPAATASPGVATVAGASAPAELSTFEIQCLECMRLALNYLKSSQAFVQSLDNPVAGTSAALSPPRLVTADTAATPADDDAASPMRVNAAAAAAAARPELFPSSSATSSTEPVACPACGQPSQKSPASDSTADPAAAVATAAAARPQSRARGAALARLMSPERKATVARTNQALLRAASVFEDTDGEGAGDIGEATPSAAGGGSGGASVGGSRRCAGCRDLMLQVDRQNDAIEALRAEVTGLVDQLEAERALRDRVQLSKDILDQELEELTAQLFDQANRMVIDEARLRDELESSNRDLRGQLQLLLRKFETREDELRDLRRSLRALEAAKLRRASRPLSAGSRSGSLSGSLTSIHAASASLTALSAAPPAPAVPHPPTAGPGGRLLGALTHSQYSQMQLQPPPPPEAESPLAGATATPPPPPPPPSLPVDGVHFAEFQDHVKTALLAASLPPARAAGAVLSTPFMRRCLAEEVEPCLFGIPLGQSPAAAAAANGSSDVPSTPHPAAAAMGGLSPSPGLLPMRRRIVEAMLRGCVDVSTVSTTTDSVPPANPAAKPRCASCSLPRLCHFRLRIADGASVSASTTNADPRRQKQQQQQQQPVGQQPPAADSYAVCRLCRDRISAAVDFFAYMRTFSLPRDPSAAAAAAGNGSEGNDAPTATTIVGMFRHATWLRRRMAASRVGSCALFEPELLVFLDRRGGGADGDWEKAVLVT